MQPDLNAQMSQSTQNSEIQQVEKELNRTDIQDIFFQVEHILLRFLTVILIFHGLISLYDEFIQLFYVFPYLPDLYRESNFSQTFYQVVFRRSIIITTAASLETIYGVILFKKQHNLAHRIHLLSSIGIVTISFMIQISVGDLDQTLLAKLPKPPTVENILSQQSFGDAAKLFSSRFSN